MRIVPVLGALALTSPAAAAPLLASGAAAPNLTLQVHNGEPVLLSSLKGEPVVVYFYPKDDTPGCTVEAKGFRDEWPRFSDLGVRVFGVSTDDAASHRAFAKKFELPFELVMDPKGEVAAAFGVPVRSGYASRITFVIGKNGKIAKVFERVNPTGHAEEILALLKKG